MERIGALPSSLPLPSLPSVSAGQLSQLFSAAFAVALLAAPHIIGAPVPDGFNGTAPPEVAGAFAARVLGVGLMVWAVLGWVAGFIWARDADKAA